MSAKHFPKGFIWGAATAAHQVEGANTASDCWALEHTKPSLFTDPSGDAIDQLNRFSDDVALLAGLGLHAYRFSLEWARVEPAEGEYSVAAVQHYQRCIDTCLARGIEPVLTFHHFTLPLWLARRGGLCDPTFSERFVRYCEFAASRLRGFRIASTINELNVPLFIRTVFLTRLRSAAGQAKLAAAAQVLGGAIDHFFLFSNRAALLDQGLKAHKKGRDAIKEFHPSALVGATLALRDEQAEPGAEPLRDQRRADFYGACFDALRGDDYVGVQNYTRVTVKQDGSYGPEPGHPLTIMGYEDRPQALAEVVRFAWASTGLPIFVTENGWAGDDDTRRQQFIREALSGLHDTIANGVDVRGYFYWSLLDNFEWLAGYGPRFGLIEVERQTQRRYIKKSALVLGEIARNNQLGAGEVIQRELSRPAGGAGEPIGI